MSKTRRDVLEKREIFIPTGNGTGLPPPPSPYSSQYAEHAITVRVYSKNMELN